MVLVLGVLLAGCGALRPWSFREEVFHPVSVHELENGLTVVLQQDDSVPLAAASMWVRVGSGDEPEELAGISHFLEHMLFKGTSRLGVGEYDRRVEAMGGALNAATSRDYTNYYVVVPSEHLGELLPDFADVLRNSTISAEEVENERQVILEEISRKADNPFGYLVDEALPRVYAEGPYTHPVIGSRETVSGFTRDEIAEHYERFYAPGNMVLVLAGDFGEEEALGLVREAFGDFERPYRPYREELPEVQYAEPAVHEFPRDWNEAYFMLTFPGPAGRDLAAAARGDVVESLLVGGRSSRLVRSVQERQGLVHSINAWFPAWRAESPLVVWGTCEPARLEEARAAIMEELERLAEEGPSGDELRRARRQAANAHLFAQETNLDRAGMLGYSMVLYGSEAYFTEYGREVEQVGRGQVRSFVREYLRPEQASVFVTRRAGE